MPKYRITYPTGRSETTTDPKKVTHAVIIKAGGRWSTWSGHANSKDAFGEAAYLAAYSRMDDVKVVPVEKIAGRS